MGDDQPPVIPQQVLDSPLHSLWSAPSVADDVGLLAGPDYPGLDDHSAIRGNVEFLIEKLAKGTTPPSVRSHCQCRSVVRYKERGFKDDPYDNSTAIPESPGKPSVALYAKQPGTYQDLSDIVLLAEIKAGAVTASIAREVDKQIRTRANGAKANEVNKHFYLIGWVGYCFRPYYWCQGEGSVPASESRRFTLAMPHNSLELEGFADSVCLRCFRLEGIRYRSFPLPWSHAPERLGSCAHYNPRS